jgi:hypothetical protein
MRSGGLRSGFVRPRRVLAAVLCAAAVGPAAAEPLVLRIRVRAEPSVEEVRAAREAVWTRSQTRARAVIASVCTGCLGAWPEAPGAAAGLEERAVPGASGPASEPPIRERRP